MNRCGIGEMGNNLKFMKRGINGVSAFLFFSFFPLFSSSNVRKFNDTRGNGIRHWPSSLAIEKKEREKRLKEKIKIAYLRPIRLSGGRLNRSGMVWRHRFIRRAYVIAEINDEESTNIQESHSHQPLTIEAEGSSSPILVSLCSVSIARLIVSR